MKSPLPFYGVGLPELRRLLRGLLAKHRFDLEADWLAAARLLWDEAAHREERYAALSLLRHRYYRRWALTPTPELLGLLEHLIVTGAWWDLVDEIASHLIGDLLRTHPAAMTPLLERWATCEDLWLRRTSILAQLGSKTTTDTSLLERCIAGSIEDQNFFARKAIGWALREYSKTDPDWVRAYVSAHPELSSLSVREALKWVNNRKSDAD